MNISAYFGALFAQWWALLSCAAFTVLSFISNFRSKSRKWQTNTAILTAAVLFVVASYRAWNAEYIKTHPGLKITIDGIETGYSAKFGAIKLLLDASISNLDSPSVADGWRLTITTNSGKTLKDLPFDLVPDSDPIKLTGDDGRSVQYSSEDNLYRKTANIPIPTGGRQTGLLSYTLPGLKQDEIDQKGTQIELRAKDVAGNIIVGTYIAEGYKGRNGFIFSPGIKEPVQIP